MAHTELDFRERRAVEDVLNAKVPVDEIAALEISARAACNLLSKLLLNCQKCLCSNLFGELPERF